MFAILFAIVQWTCIIIALLAVIHYGSELNKARKAKNQIDLIFFGIKLVVGTAWLMLLSHGV